MLNHKKLKIVLVGTANPYRGGLATFNERLVLEFQNQGHEVEIFNFTLQYPSFLFPGKSQYLESPHTDLVKSTRKVNSINPLNWVKVGYELYKMRPDIIIFRYWISFMAPCYAVIAWIAKRNGISKIFTIVDNAISHEPKFYERIAAKFYFLVSDYFLAMSQKVIEDLRLLTKKPAVFCHHPLYDTYAPAISKAKARENLQLLSDEKIILFFGFIRDYKGLDLLFSAMNETKIRNLNIKLLVAGEFYSNREQYFNLVKKMKLTSQILWHTEFIPDEKISDYFCAADAVVLPYRSATQSGVTQIAYVYHTPVIATNVGGIKEMVRDQIHGLIIEPTAESIADGISKFYTENLESEFRKNIERDKSKFSWTNFVQTIVEEVQ